MFNVSMFLFRLKTNKFKQNKISFFLHQFIVYLFFCTSKNFKKISKTKNIRYYGNENHKIIWMFLLNLRETFYFISGLSESEGHEYIICLSHRYRCYIYF